MLAGLSHSWPDPRLSQRSISITLNNHEMILQLKEIHFGSHLVSLCVCSLSETLYDSLKNYWDKVFKNGPGKICGRQPLKNLKWHDLIKADHTPPNFLKAVFHKFYLIHS